MFSFKKEQKVYKIGNVKVGGQPGENPTVLIGTMFYSGHKIVQNRKKGEFDKERAAELIKTQEELSKQTGIPCMLDVVAILPEEYEVYLDFVTSITDMPIVLDAWKIPPKLAGAKYAAEHGLTEKVIYSSIAPWSEDIKKEIDAVKQLGLKNCIVVAYNPADKTPQGRVNILKESLLQNARDAGFENILIDTSNLNIPTLAFNLLANYKVKEEFGLPVGCAPSNGTDMWKMPKQVWGKMGFAGVDSGCHAIASILWNDFLLYGPIESAPWIFPAVATANTILSTLVYTETQKLPSDPNNPLNKLFPEFLNELKGLSHN